jgi:glycosyltransferase involved in cell wall biosynthesis
VTAGGAELFDPHDADALAALVTRLGSDSDLRSRLRTTGRKIAARYTWAATAAALWEEARQAVVD